MAAARRRPRPPAAPAARPATRCGAARGADHLRLDAARVGLCRVRPGPARPTAGRARFVAVGSGSGLEKRPNDRNALWESCRERSDFDLVVAPAGWRMAGIIRERQVAAGDVLIVLSGGAGGEHLAQLYRSDGEPVIPLNAQLGASQRDGSGDRLHTLCSSTAPRFVVCVWTHWGSGRADGRESADGRPAYFDTTPS